jgi:hypothetical protein
MGDMADNLRGPETMSGMICPVAEPEHYEERYRFPAEYARLLFVCAAFSVAALILPLPGIVRFVELVIFGGGVVALLVLGLRTTRQVAVRADADGLAIGRRPTRFTYTTEVTAWRDVSGVRLAKPKATAGPPVVVLTATRRAGRGAVETPVKGWKLDVDKFTAALANHAPRVRVVDTR